MSYDLNPGEVRSWFAPAWADPDSWTTGQRDANTIIQQGHFATISIAPDSQIDTVTIKPANAQQTFVVSPNNPLPAGDWYGPILVGGLYESPYGVDNTSTIVGPRNWQRLHSPVASIFTNTANGKPCISNPRVLFTSGVTNTNAWPGVGGFGLGSGPLLSLRIHGSPIVDGRNGRCPEAVSPLVVDVPVAESVVLAIPMMGRTRISFMVNPAFLACSYRVLAYKMLQAANAGGPSRTTQSKQVYPGSGTVALAAGGAVDTFTFENDYVDYLGILASAAVATNLAINYEARD